MGSLEAGSQDKPSAVYKLWEAFFLTEHRTVLHTDSSIQLSAIKLSFDNFKDLIKNPP